jgi:lipoprotein signal peptidase
MEKLSFLLLVQRLLKVFSTQAVNFLVKHKIQISIGTVDNVIPSYPSVYNTGVVLGVFNDLLNRVYLVFLFRG